MLLTSIISQWYSHYIPIDEVFPSNHSTHVGYISHVISPWNISIKYRWPTVGLNPPIKNHQTTARQWPFQEPKLEVPTIYKAYARYSTSILGSWNSHWVARHFFRARWSFSYSKRKCSKDLSPMSSWRKAERASGLNWRCLEWLGKSVLSIGLKKGENIGKP